MYVAAIERELKRDRKADQKSGDRMREKNIKLKYARGVTILQKTFLALTLERYSTFIYAIILINFVENHQYHETKGRTATNVAK